MWNYTVVEEELEVLKVNVIEGRGVTVGFSDIVDIPDPYCILEIPNSPDGKRRTKTIPNNPNPKWNEEFKFYLPAEAERMLHINIYDEDTLFDDKVGKATYDLTQLKHGEKTFHTLRFKKGVCVDVEMTLEIDNSKDLRYSHDLCDEEKDFLEKRRNVVMENIQTVLEEEDRPRNENEVPVVAIMGSGGGLRATCSLAGAFSALESHNILQCATYIAALSGSSWYTSTYYSHPNPDITCDEIAAEIKQSLSRNLLHHLTPSHLSKFHKHINKKKADGHPVSFTDFFGCLVGETLLKNMFCKFSDIKQRVNNGQQPLLLCSAIHVERDLSAQDFNEWIEFSPFEYGIAKYGVFSKTENFGGKFYKGRLVEETEEQCLHYLQGIWGSAFTILFQRLLNPSAYYKDDGRRGMVQFCSTLKRHRQVHDDSDTSSDEVEDEEEKPERTEVDGDTAEEDKGYLHALLTPLRWMARNIACSKDVCCRVLCCKAVCCKACCRKRTRIVRGVRRKKYKDQKFWINWLNAVVSHTALKTREGRAARTHNICRGLTIEQNTEQGDRVIDTSQETTFLVDAGLHINSPYPLLLRQERKVDLILSFDFSQREKDDTLPFEELLLAEEWARHHDIPFPSVKYNPIIKDPDIKELYVFEDENDDQCPTIMHFVLINKTFREFKEPGVARETEEERKFGNFDVFSDPKKVFSTFKTAYTSEQFERIFHLTKFNTLLNIERIKEKMATIVKRKRNNNL